MLRRIVFGVRLREAECDLYLSYVPNGVSFERLKH